VNGGLNDEHNSKTFNKGDEQFWMHKPRKRDDNSESWIKYEFKWKKCMNDDLVRLLGTHLNQKQNHTCVNDVISAYLIDEVIWKCVEMMLSANLCC
jgi:hypothetical protein